MKIITEHIELHIYLVHDTNSWYPLTWKNDNCKVMNDILPLSYAWKVQRMVDLVGRFYDIVKLQTSVTKRFTYGLGKYTKIQEVQVSPWEKIRKGRHEMHSGRFFKIHKKSFEAKLILLTVFQKFDKMG